MEKLILKCGRFVPSASGNVEQRVAHIETYLGRMTEELEHLLGELERPAEVAVVTTYEQSREEGSA